MVTKAEKREATLTSIAGLDANKAGQPRESNPYPEGSKLRDPWFVGWDRQKERTELGQTDDNSPATVPMKPSDKKSKPAESGHDFKDPDVVNNFERLAELMTAFDNVGIQIEEVAWRKFSNPQQSIAATWANDMRIGRQRPVPDFLMPFATDALKQSAVNYFEQQAEQRKIIVRCRFNKPSPILPTGDEGEDAIKMTLSIPESDINRPSIAEEFFVGKRLHVEFSRRASDQWKPELPGIEQQPEIISCETEVKGYKRLMKGYVFGFKILTDLIDDNTAVRQYANHEGSCRLTLLGDIVKAEPKQESTAATVAKARPLAGQKELPIDGNKKPKAKQEFDKQITKGEFLSPDEFMIPSKTKDCSAVVVVGDADNGKFHASFSCVFIDQDDNEREFDYGNPKLTDAGYVSEQFAVKAMVGRAIDLAMKQKAVSGFLNDLRSELKRLEDGGSPIPMPDA